MLQLDELVPALRSIPACCRGCGWYEVESEEGFVVARYCGRGLNFPKKGSCKAAESRADRAAHSRLPFHYTTCCVDSDAESITAMVEGAVEIAGCTFRRWVNAADLRALEQRLGYGQGRGDLRLAKDWHVSYHRSHYRGRLCVYLVHSCIEFVFAAPEVMR